MAPKARGKGNRGKAKPAPARRRRKPVKPQGPWGALTLAILLVVLSLRLAVNATEPMPVHFDEAQYWAYGQELDWGYFSKPPLVAWLIRAITDVAGDTLFALRLASPIAHGLIAWLIFLTGRRLWDGKTGFWAATGYTAAPGVGLSAMIMSTDPVLMVLWAAALYVLVRAAETEAEAGVGAGGQVWWGALGALIGAGMMAKYSMVAFAVGALGYGLFAARARNWSGTATAMVAVIALVSPNIVWNADNSFVTVAHVMGDADPGHGYFNIGALVEFTAAQFAVIGPVFLIAIYLALRNRSDWRDDWGMRLMAWQTVPLLAGMIGLSFLTRAQANWAAPAYVAGSLLAARWLVTAGGARALQAQLAVGVAASLGLWTVAGLYAGQAEGLTSRLDPFRQMRISEPFCELVLGAMSEEGAGVLLSDNRRRLSECMYYGGLGWDEVAIWNPDAAPANHHELVATLYPGDQREMLLVVQSGAASMAGKFEEAREVESGSLETHIDRSVPFSMWVVRGFKGY
ncbi:MAG TPA: glycosyltransferase family 39 protein [Thermohalobaculum sp.]|nr:glycosyltransferase family 39 protein [Thermohalobaculum sp.]